MLGALIMEPTQTPVKLTRRQEVWKFFQFLFFSLSAGLIQILVYTLLNGVFKLEHYALSYLPAIVASVLWNFTVNRKFTFKSASNVPVAMLKVAAYNAVFIPLSTWWGNELEKLLPAGMDKELWGYIILIGTMLINFVTEFCVYRFWVFRKSINTSKEGIREQERILASQTEHTASQQEDAAEKEPAMAGQSKSTEDQ